jgi:hypothetical protein
MNERREKAWTCHRHAANTERANRRDVGMRRGPLFPPFVYARAQDGPSVGGYSTGGWVTAQAPISEYRTEYRTADEHSRIRQA